MEEIQHQNLHTRTQLMSTQFLKKVTQLVVSVYVFSCLFSQSSLLSFLNSYNFSALPYQLITHTIDKNCMFLLCNGLLVFLAKYSDLLSSLSLSNHPDESFTNMVDDNPPENSMPQAKEKKLILDSEVAEENIAKDIGDEKETEENDFYTNKISKKEEESRECVVEDEEEQKWINGDTLFGERVEKVEDKVEVEEEENGKLSTEELNQKFDEFIRKMKQELRIEAQRQLIMV